MKTCKREGCELAASTRGMCRNHYRGWMSRMQRRGLKVARSTIADQLQHVLPATRKQMAARLGVTDRAIQYVVPKLHADGKMHIVGFEPPTAHTGPWQAIFAWGQGQDVQPDPAMRKAYRKERKRAANPQFNAVIAAMLGPALEAA